MENKAETKVKINKDPEIIDRLLNRATEEILPSKEELKKLLLSGRRLNVYQGFDPTADTLHIGHSVGMRKLRDLQLLGHRVIFLIGDFTGRIGDPTDKSSSRQKLTAEQVKKNLKNYKEQASKILDFNNKENPIEVMYNSTWHDKLTFTELIELTSEFSVQQMLKRDMFKKRLEADKPIYVHEFLYPIMQGYDSVAMDIDIEVGGNDQVFNMLAGRDMVRSLLKKEKFVLPNKLLTDPNGKKMGKSEGNMIMLSDSSKDMYGKVMAFPDGMICPAYELLTDIEMNEIENMQKMIDEETVNPMELKKRLALIITTEHKGEREAIEAQKFFEEAFQNKGETVEDAESIESDKKTITIIEALTEIAGFSSSNGEAKRLIRQNAVSVNEEKITDISYQIELPQEGIVIRAGKQIAHIIPNC